MFRPLDSSIVDTEANFTSHDPIIPYGVFAVNSDGTGFKLGDGVNVWSALSYQGSSAIRNKQVQSSRDPTNNELLIYCEATDKWIYRLQHCFDTVSNWESNNSVFPTSTLLIETANLTSIPTGRFKIGDGSTTFDALPWFGTDFATGDFSVGESIEFNGQGWDPVTYLQPTQLQAATTPAGKFHRDDGTWSELVINLTDLESIVATYGVFDTVYVGGFPTEATSVTLTSDGIDLFSDGNKVWTTYNDGEGSGLDADTLDGHHADTFLIMEYSGTPNNFVSFGTTGSNLIDSEYNASSFATAGHTHVSSSGDVTGPATSVIGNIVTFNSTDGKSIVDSGYDVSDFATTTHTHDYSGTYLGISAKASDSNLLDGLDSTAFATTNHIHITYVTDDDALAYSIAFGG